MNEIQATRIFDRLSRLEMQILHARSYILEDKIGELEKTVPFGKHSVMLLGDFLIVDLNRNYDEY